MIASSKAAFLRDATTILGDESLVQDLEAYYENVGYDDLKALIDGSHVASEGNGDAGEEDQDQDQEEAPVVEEETEFVEEVADPSVGEGAFLVCACVVLCLGVGVCCSWVCRRPLYGRRRVKCECVGQLCVLVCKCVCICVTHSLMSPLAE